MFNNHSTNLEKLLNNIIYLKTDASNELLELKNLHKNDTLSNIIDPTTYYNNLNTYKEQSDEIRNTFFSELEKIKKFQY